jgi:hypothetical protein
MSCRLRALNSAGTISSISPWTPSEPASTTTLPSPRCAHALLNSVHLRLHAYLTQVFAGVGAHNGTMFW